MSGVLEHRRVQGYGWVPSRPDPRDRPLKLGAGAPNQKVDLRTDQAMPAIVSQLQLGSCTANGLGAAWEYELHRQGTPVEAPSRLFVYYGEREIEGTIGQDSGAQIRDGIKVLANLGAPPETDWPYTDANPGPFQEKPPAKAYGDALQHRALKYWACPLDAAHLQWCLSRRYLVVFGFTVFSSFESQDVASTGIVPMPDPAKEQVLGGHCVALVGFNASAKTWQGCPPGHYIVKNSWGPDWGDRGYCYMPFEMLHNPSYCSDGWTIRAVK